jgi:type I restriction enzyme S subunit
MVKLGTCLQRRKDTVMPATLSDTTIGLVGLEDIQDGGRGGISIRQTPPQEIESLKTRFVAGDILYGKLRPYLNKVGIAPQSGLCSTEIWAFSPSSLVDPKYAAFFLASSFFVDRVSSLIKGANLPRVDTEAFDSIEIPLPPLSEQQRIVAILQEAEAIRRLRAEAETKTAELIPAMFAATIDTSTQTLRECVLGDELSSIETGWSPVASSSSASRGEWGVLKLGAVSFGRYNDAENKALLAGFEPKPQIEVKEGDILLVRKNTKELVGASVYVHSTRPGLMFSDLIFRLRPKIGANVLPKFLSTLLNHPYYRAKLSGLSGGAAESMVNIPKSRLLKLRITVPTLDVQRALIERLNQAETALSVTEQAALINSTLTASLSAHAFSGHLTADWREANKEKPAIEARERDGTLAEAGSAPRISRRATIQELDGIFADRTDGIYSDLNREQHFLLREIDRMFAGVDYGRYFTAEKIADEVEGPLHRNPQGVLAHLQVFAARGLLIPVSRRRKDATGSPFAGCYRLPLKASETLIFPGVEDIELSEQHGDDVRGELMKIQRRLATGAI